MRALITRKLGMTSVIKEDGSLAAITLLSASPNTVIQAKTVDKDGYDALQLGFENSKKLGKSKTGHFKNSKAKAKVVREFRITQASDDTPSVGATLSADVFEVGDNVDVAAVTKGKGFAGVIKRHGFALGGKSHGNRSYRRPGSIGSMYPQRIFPGKKMSGHMGHRRVTTKNLTIAIVDVELGVIGIEGAVPGPAKGLVLIKGTNK